ncbi:uncharacterized protein LOC141612382 [Silene latifolia]|uniref:uncharacterized protein LOC141612382 n=1 Tax=Silene latifolia TaxID=37657 RepID=UPI003D76B72D
MVNKKEFIVAITNLTNNSNYKFTVANYNKSDLMAETKLSLTLLIDSKANKVLFAEAGKDFVDFLFHILSLPVGTVVKLLNESATVGCIGSLYKSVESLNSEYFQANVNKNDVLKPKAVVNVPLLELNDVPATASRKIYTCSCCRAYWSHDPSTICPHCHNRIINLQLQYAPPPDAAIVASGGYVKEGIIFMVMDNLEVKPLSTMSGISVMDKFNIKDYSGLVEKKVQVGFTEGLAMLKASLEVTDSVLTTVFLIKKEV